MMRNSFFLICFFISLQMWAQSQLTVAVKDAEEGKLIPEARVLVVQDSIVVTKLTDETGFCVFEELPYGDWVLSASKEGYETQSTSIELSQPEKGYVFELTPALTELADFVVEADKSDLTIQTATGQKYFLSKRALALSNPFQAIAEVPALKVDFIKHKVSSLFGDEAVVLVNGENWNHALESVKPSDIEYVEVINVPDASYLASGVSFLVNVVTKKKIAKYVFFKADANDVLPFQIGSSNLIFEIGSPKFSFFNWTSASADFRRKSQTDESQHNANYLLQDTRHRKHTNWHADYNGRVQWSITDKDFFGTAIMVSFNGMKSQENAMGMISSNSLTGDYDMEEKMRSRSNTLFGRLSYKHLFNDNSYLEFAGAVSYDYYRQETDRFDEYGAEKVLSPVSLSTKGFFARANLKYVNRLTSSSELNIGFNTDNSNDHIKNGLEDDLKYHNRLNVQLLYASYRISWGKWLAFASVGAQYTSLKSGSFSDNYLSPWGTASIVWQPSNVNAFRFTYRHTNGNPTLQMQNPFTTRYNPLKETIGNQKLRPYHSDGFYLYYFLTLGKLTVNPGIETNYTTKCIRRYGYTEGDTYYETYVNTGKMLEIAPLVAAQMRLPIGSVWTSFRYPMKKYEGTGYFKNPLMAAGFNGSSGKWGFQASFTYAIHQEDLYSFTTGTLPLFSVDVTYQATPNFVVGLGSDTLFGNYRSKTKYADGTYSSDSRWRTVGYAFLPRIYLSWTLRRNEQNRTKFDVPDISGRSSYSL